MTFVDWWTNNNNPSLPKSEYLYKTRHIIVLLLAVTLCIAFYFIFRNKSKKSKQILFNVFASILLFFEILSRIVNLCITTDYSWQNILKIILPMHICSVMVWVFIVAIFSKNKILINFGTIGGLIATLAFLLYPAVGLNRVYISFTCLYSTFSHMLGFVCAISMISLKMVKFDVKKIWQPFLCFTIMFIYGALLNFVILPGSDYMYMINDPLELNLAFPYQILYVMILSLYISSFYLCSQIKAKIIKHKQNKTKLKTTNKI